MPTGSNSSTQIGCRVPNELMRLKRNEETMSEFVVRAFTALRDGKKVENNGTEHVLLEKMIKVFAQKGIKMELTQEEIEVVKRLYK